MPFVGNILVNRWFDLEECKNKWQVIIESYCRATFHLHSEFTVRIKFIFRMNIKNYFVALEVYKTTKWGQASALNNLSKKLDFAINILRNELDSQFSPKKPPFGVGGCCFLCCGK